MTSGSLGTRYPVRTVIDERYEVLSLVGRGGMANVYEGWDRRLGRRVALKMLHDDLSGDERSLARFRREARAAAALTHPHIASVHDAGTHHDVPYIAMEFVDGRTLAEVLAEEGPLPPARVAEVGMAIAGALACAHAAGIVHRDLKPGNVMLTAGGEAKVVDFGIAWAARWTPLAHEPSVQGTAEYLSPEQARGDDVDGRSDIYSLGVVLYELLTGRPPFLGEAPLAVAYRHLEESPAAPEARRPGVPAALSAVAMRCLAKSPGDRYPSADAVRTDLVRFLAGEPPATAPLPGPGTTDVLPPGWPDPQPETPPRGGARWVVPALVAVALAAAGVFVLRTEGPEPPRAPAPALSPPTGLAPQESCDGFLAARITLRWIPASSPVADGYEIYRGTTAGGPYDRVGWVPGRNVTSFVDDGLRPGRTYVYVVRATAGTRASPPSAEAETRTPFACLW